jgi:hypothetical protein
MQQKTAEAADLNTTCQQLQSAANTGTQATMQQLLTADHRASLRLQVSGQCTPSSGGPAYLPPGFVHAQGCRPEDTVDVPDPQENLAAVTADLATANAKVAELQAALSTAHLELTAARASATAKQVQTLSLVHALRHHTIVDQWHVHWQASRSHCCAIIS